jgi:hypothetical protein
MFSTMPRVRAKPMLMRGKPVAFMVHRTMVPAVLDPSSGDLTEIEDEDQWHRIERELQPLRA